MRYVAVTEGYTGAIELYGEKDTIPAREETWTLTCERMGRVVATRAISVDRVDVGSACKKAKS